MEKCQYGVEINIEEVQRKYEGELKGVISLQKVTNYLSAAQLYLKDNFLLREKLYVNGKFIIFFIPGLGKKIT